MAIVFHQIRIPNGVDFRLNLGNDINRMIKPRHRQPRVVTIWSTGLYDILIVVESVKISLVLSYIVRDILVESNIVKYRQVWSSIDQYSPI